MANPNPTQILLAGIDAYLAALPANEFDDLVARTRDPEEPGDDKPEPAAGVARLAAAFNDQTKR